VVWMERDSSGLIELGLEKVKSPKCPDPIRANATGIWGAHHRSAFSCATVRENRTLPRSLRRREYVCEAATSCNPVRTVWVTPVPLAR